MSDRKPRVKETAESLGKRQREISVSEFFAKNRHLLGFDNPRKALLTTVKEAVDNALDACEEAGTLPEIQVVVSATGEDRYRVSVTDNGPGIVKAQIPKIFGKLLYGSKFHTLKQSRGQQGIGISAAGMYGQLTTGKPVLVISRPAANRPAHHYEIRIDTRNNRPEIVREETVEWDEVPTGTRVEIEIAGKFIRGRHSVGQYLELTALANPHATIRYADPEGETTVYERSTAQLPDAPSEIKPHPYGVELGTLITLLKDTRERSVHAFLRHTFSRVSDRVADEVLTLAGVSARERPAQVAAHHAQALYDALNRVKLMAPPTACISPIGAERIEQSLRQKMNVAFATAVTRSPAVYRGNPFLIEAGLAFGGDLPADDLAVLHRFANRVPLLYEQGACAITDAVVSTDWKNYGLVQARGALPTGPLVIFVHIASVWVPFTSESKEAVAGYEEIIREVRLALQECGRRLGLHVGRQRREADAARKRSYIEQYIPHIGIALQEILGLSDKQRDQTNDELRQMLERSRSG